MEIVNYHKTPQNIFVQVDVEYADGKVGEDARQGQMGSMRKYSCYRISKRTTAKTAQLVIMHSELSIPSRTAPAPFRVIRIP